MMLHVTDLATYLYCPRKLYLAKVLQLKEPPKDVLVLGTIRHEVTEAIHKKEEQIVKGIETIEQEHIQQQYITQATRLLRTAIIKHKRELQEFQLELHEVFARQWNPLLQQLHHRIKQTLKFADQHQVTGTQLWEQLTPKILPEVRVESSSFELKGIVDQIEQYPSYLIPVELKTGRAPAGGMWPGHKIQLGAYLYLVEESLQQPTKEGRIHYLDADVAVPLQQNPFLKEEILTIKEKAKQTLQSKALPPYVQNRNKCHSCGFREQCYNKEFMEAQIQERNREPGTSEAKAS